MPGEHLSSTPLLKVCRVPGAKVTQLDWRSRGGTTSGDDHSASLMWSGLAPLSLLKPSSLPLIRGKIDSFHVMVPVGPDLEPLHISLE